MDQKLGTVVLPSLPHEAAVSESAGLCTFLKLEVFQALVVVGGVPCDRRTELSAEGWHPTSEGHHISSPEGPPLGLLTARIAV